MFVTFWTARSTRSGCRAATASWSVDLPAPLGPTSTTTEACSPILYAERVDTCSAVATRRRGGVPDRSRRGRRQRARTFPTCPLLSRIALVVAEDISACTAEYKELITKRNELLQRRHSLREQLEHVKSEEYEQACQHLKSLSNFFKKQRIKQWEKKKLKQRFKN